MAGLFVLCGRYRHPHVVPPSREGKVRWLLWEAFYFAEGKCEVHHRKTKEKNR